MPKHKHLPARVTSSAKKKFLLCCGIIIILIAAAITLLELTDITHLFHTKPVAVTGSPATKVPQQPKTSTQTQPSISNSVADDTTRPSDIKHPGADDENMPVLKPPTGTFANVYKADENQQMTSTCGTTSGATCQIIFTNGSQTVALSDQQTDRGGGTAWEWTPKSVGLSTGTWHITAKATLGSQTKTTSNDPLTLEIIK